MDSVEDYPEVDRGNSLAEEGKHEEAIVEFREVQRKGEAWVALNIGNSLRALGRRDEASDEFSKAWELHQDMDSALNLASLMEESSPEDSRELLRTLAQRGYGKAAANEAWNLVDEGRIGKAEAILTMLLANPESVDRDLVEGTLGTILTRDGRPELAEPYLASAAESVPWARADWGHLLLARGDAKSAVQVWTRGMDNDEVESMVPLANHLSDVGEKAQAERVYRRAIELGDAYAATNLAIDLWDSGDKDEARELFKQADMMGDPVAHSLLASNADET